MKPGEVVPYPEWRDLLDKTHNRERGSVVSHEEIAKITGLKRDSSRWKSTVNAWKKRMLVDYDKYLIAVNGSGYRIANASDHETLGRKVVRQGIKRIAKARTIMIHVDRSVLDEKQKASLDRHVYALGQLAAVGIFELKELPKRTEKPNLPRLLTG